MTLRRALAASIAIASILFGGGALARPAKVPVAKHDTKKKAPRSFGAPNSGHLEGAALLKGSKHLRNRQGAHSWALPEMVHALRHASDEVGKKYKGSQLLVGDLSGRTGGFLKGHNSHQSGRDADIAFYVMNAKGKPVAAKHFIAFDGNGRGKELEWAVFDDARNWALVEALLKDEKAHVRYLFIVNNLKTRLLAYAQKHHVTKELYLKAAGAMMSPEDADVHDDHFHVRISCPETTRDTCTEESVVRAKTDAQADDAKPADVAVDEPAKAESTTDSSAQ